MVTVRIIALAFVLAVCSASCDQRTKRPEAVLPNASLDRVGTSITVELPTFGIAILDVVEAAAPEFGDTFQGDELVLRIRNVDGALQAEHRFHSSYGRFRLDVVDFDGNANPEFVLVAGRGRGTSVRTESIEVLSLDQGKFVSCLSADRSGFFGGGAYWEYVYEYRDADNDGVLEIHMQLQHTPVGEGIREHPETIPTERSRVLVPKRKQ